MAVGVCDTAPDHLALQVRGLSALLETVAHENIVAAGAVDGSHVAVLCDPDGHLLVVIDQDWRRHAKRLRSPGNA